MKRIERQKPLSSEELRALALAYVGRYATSTGKLTAYLARKVRERGWAGGNAAVAEIDAVVARMAELRYVDDQSYADMKAASLTRRGYGPRRVRQALTAAGIGADMADTALTPVAEAAETLALDFARRKRLGPFSQQPQDPKHKARAFAMMLRAGHEYAAVRRILDLEADFVHNSLDRSDV
ncbi:MAG: regulatory protein RecX [Chakrabartia sp.]